MPANRNRALSLVLVLVCGVLVVVLGITLLPVSVEWSQRRVYRDWVDFSRLGSVVASAVSAAPAEVRAGSLKELREHGDLPEDLYRFAVKNRVEYLPADVEYPSESKILLRMHRKDGGSLIYTADGRCYPTLEDQR